jgi:intein/homing endonuclease
MTRADHCGLHAKNRKTTDKTRRLLSEAGKRNALRTAYRNRQKNNWDRFVEDSKKWHKSEEGLKWHKEHAKKIWNKEYREKLKKVKKCKNCGEEFISKNGSGEYCKPYCKNLYREKTGVDNENRSCVICKKTFTVNKYKKKITCSKKCAIQAAKDKKQKKEYNHRIIKIEEGPVQDVYNMQVENVNNFSCNGIIVHNCDSMRYLCMIRHFMKDLPQKEKTIIQKDIERLLRPKVYNDFDID